MHIAFFNPQGNFDNNDSYWTEHPDFGGQLVYVKELALALDRQGHEVVIFTRRIDDPQWPEFREPEETYQGSGVKIVRLPFGGNTFLRKEELWPYLHSYVKEVKEWYHQWGRLPDVVTTHYGDGGVTGAMFQEMTGIPYTFTAHSLGAQKLDKLLTHEDNFSALDKQYQFIIRLAAERIAIDLAIVRIVSTEQEKNQQYQHSLYKDLFESDTDKLFAVVPPGVNRYIFSEQKAAIDVMVEQEFTRVSNRDIDHKRQTLPISIASSRLDPKKNVTGLVEAYGENKEWQHKSNLMLAVRGLDEPGKDIHQLKPEERVQMEIILRIMAKHELAGKVTFINLGSQQALAAAYRIVAKNKGVFCLTSLYEPFGLATIEAMSCGVPVVVTENGGGSEILKDHKETFGILINPEDNSSISEGALRLLSKEENWTHYRNQGLFRVKTTYTWEAAAKGYITSISNVKKINNFNDYEELMGMNTGINTKELTYFKHPSVKNRHQLYYLEEKINTYIRQISSKLRQND